MLIAFSGYKTAGKDAAASVLINEYGFKKIALADPVRALAYAINPIVSVDFDITSCPGGAGDYEFHDWSSVDIRLQWLIDKYGWDHCKNTYPEVRRLMQAVGTEGGRKLFGENFWIDQLDNSISDLWSSNTRYVLTDARFLNEGYWVQDAEGNREENFRMANDISRSYFDAPSGRLFWIERPGLAPDGHASESGELREIADAIIHNDGTVEELKLEVRFEMAVLNIINKN